MSFRVWRALSSFWVARRRLDHLTRRDRQHQEYLRITSFQTAWEQRNFSEMWALAFRLSGRPLGPKETCPLSIGCFEPRDPGVATIS